MKGLRCACGKNHGSVGVIKGQSRRFSALETTVNIVSGFLLAFLTQALIYPVFGFHSTVEKNLGLALVFSAISWIRGLFWRRVFNWLQVKGVQ